MARRTAVGQPAPLPTTAAGCRESWAELQRLWQQTIARACRLPEARLQERVDSEWSFVETLRHLLFVTDAWASRALLGIAAPYHPLDLPPTAMRNAALPRDEAARPPLADVLALRAERLAAVQRLLAELTDEALATATVRVRGPGYPRSGVYPVSRCVHTLIREEWLHRLYAERDLASLERG